MGDPISPQNTLFLPLFDHFFWGGEVEIVPILPNLHTINYIQNCNKLYVIQIIINSTKFFQYSTKQFTNSTKLTQTCKNREILQNLEIFIQNFRKHRFRCCNFVVYKYVQLRHCTGRQKVYLAMTIPTHCQHSKRTHSTQTSFVFIVRSVRLEISE